MTGQLNDSCPDLLVISRYNYLREGFVADELFKHWKQEVRVSLSFQAPSSSPKTFFISSSGILYVFSVIWVCRFLKLHRSGDVRFRCSGHCWRFDNVNTGMSIIPALVTVTETRVLSGSNRGLSAGSRLILCFGQVSHEGLWSEVIKSGLSSEIHTINHIRCNFENILQNSYGFVSHETYCSNVLTIPSLTWTACPCKIASSFSEYFFTQHLRFGSFVFVLQANHP